MEKINVKKDPVRRESTEVSPGQPGWEIFYSWERKLLQAIGIVAYVNVIYLVSECNDYFLLIDLIWFHVMVRRNFWKCLLEKVIILRNDHFINQNDHWIWT